MPPNPAQAIRALEQAQELITTAIAQLQPDPPSPAMHLTPQQRAILAAATGSAAPTRTLARRAGCSHNPRFRENVRILTDQGLLVRTSRGYHLAFTW